MELSPALVLATWIAGIAGGAAVVAWWRIVGPGYAWMSGAVVAGFGAIEAAAGGGAAALVGTDAGAATILNARRRDVVAALYGVATIGFVLAAWQESPLVPVLTGTLFLGGVTSEMLLGHWYLVDPKLPRWALQRLCVAAGIGLAAEVALVVGGVMAGGLDSGAVFAWAYAALSVMTALLLAAVWFSLREPRYTGVMSATGLSYLAVLTSMGVFVVGRMVAFG